MCGDPHLHIFDSSDVEFQAITAITGGAASLEGSIGGYLAHGLSQGEALRVIRDSLGSGGFRMIYIDGIWLGHFGNVVKISGWWNMIL